MPSPPSEPEVPFAFCGCDCHTNRAIMHFTACCSGTCGQCGDGYHNLKEHEKTCNGRYVYRSIEVAKAERLLEDHRKDVVVIVAIDHQHGCTHITTFGRNERDKRNAAELGEDIQKLLGLDPATAEVHEDLVEANIAALKLSLPKIK